MDFQYCLLLLMAGIVGHDGLTRGMSVVDTGAPLSVPVGEITLDQIFNVLGEPMVYMGPVESSIKFPIDRSAPAFTQLDTKLSIFETGIKVVDPLALYRRSGKIGHDGAFKHGLLNRIQSPSICKLWANAV